MEGNPQKQTTALSDRELEIIGRQLPASPPTAEQMECFDVDDEIEFPCVKVTWVRGYVGTIVPVPVVVARRETDASKRAHSGTSLFS
jgi:hypothetical protein